MHAKRDDGLQIWREGEGEREREIERENRSVHIPVVFWQYAEKRTLLSEPSKSCSTSMMMRERKSRTPPPPFSDQCDILFFFLLYSCFCSCLSVSAHASHVLSVMFSHVYSLFPSPIAHRPCLLSLCLSASVCLPMTRG